MPLNKFTFTFAFILFFIPGLVCAHEPIRDDDLPLCSDIKLGYKIVCNPEWGLETRENQVIMLIKDGPDEFITATISKTKEKVLSLDKVSRQFLQIIGQYEDHFPIVKTSLNGRTVLKVEAKAKKISDMQLLDYYLLKNSYLYAVQFACQPAVHYDEHKPLFEKMIQSLEFLK